jgi:hypothetical protein
MDKLLYAWMIFSTVVTLASIIAAVTPTKRDDEIVAKVRWVANLLAINLLHAKPIPPPVLADGTGAGAPAPADGANDDAKAA